MPTENFKISDIILLKFDKPYKMFEQFCHESAHKFLHAMNQRNMAQDFNMLQEV